MPVLKDPKHERFAQGLAAGMMASDAYINAGYKSPGKGNASRLKSRPQIMDRVQELLDVPAKKLQEKLEVTPDRVLAEMAKIAFSDIRRVIKWSSNLVRQEDNPAGGDVAVITHIVNNTVTLVPSDDLDDDTAASIESITQTQTGGLRIKLYDKRAALVDLGKHLGLFAGKDAGNGGQAQDGGPPNAPQPTGADHLEEIARRYAGGRLGVVTGGKR